MPDESVQTVWVGDPLESLMEEHARVLAAAAALQDAARATDAAVDDALRNLRAESEEHVAREERGLFAVLSEKAEFAEAVELVELHHRDLSAQLERIEAGDHGLIDGFVSQVRDLVRLEDEHIFPAARRALRRYDWERVVLLLSAD